MIVVLQESQNLLKGCVGNKTQGDPMVDQSVRHPNALLFFEGFQPLDDNFSLPKLNVKLVSLWLCKAVQPEECPAVVQFLSHPIFGHANVVIEGLRGFLLTSRFAWLRPPPFIRIRQTAWPGTLQGTFPSMLLRAGEAGNKADSVGRLGILRLCHARIS